MQSPPGVSMPTVNPNRTCGRILRLCLWRIWRTGDLNSRSTTRTYCVLTEEGKRCLNICAVTRYIIFIILFGILAGKVYMGSGSD